MVVQCAQGMNINLGSKMMTYSFPDPKSRNAILIVYIQPLSSLLRTFEILGQPPETSSE